jgi:hypothetical protein
MDVASSARRPAGGDRVFMFLLEGVEETRL